MIKNIFLPIKLFVAACAVAALTACGGSPSTNLTSSAHADENTAALDMEMADGPVTDYASGYLVTSGSSSSGTSNGSVVYAINAGGDPYVASNGISYSADKYWVGGDSKWVTTPIAGTVDDMVYYSQRFGIFRYSMPIAKGSYEVTLQFREPGTTTSRLINVAIEGKTVVANFDVANTTGLNTAIQHVLPNIAVEDGYLDINFSSANNNAMVSGIVVKTMGSVTPVATPAPAVFYAINAGGGSHLATNGVLYGPDKYFAGGDARTVNTSIKNTMNWPLHTSQRFGVFSYNFPAPAGTYEVTLQFSDLASVRTSRVMNIYMEDKLVLANFDVAALVGLKSAMQRIITGVQVTDGTLNIRFTSPTSNAMVSALVVKPSSKLISSSSSSSSTTSSSSSGGDVTAPTNPAGLQVFNVLNKQLSLSWSAATDNVGVAQYRVLRNGAVIATLASSALTHTDTGLTPDTGYTYSVVAVDAAGNQSLSSSSTIATKTFVVGGLVTMEWVAPTARDNLQPMSATEIGGYKIRYKLRTEADSAYRIETVASGKTSFVFLNLVGDYVFQIATYDSAGVFSNYVNAALK